MHFWIDKRSSQLHQYGGGGRRGAGGSGGFYSQNFGTHRSTHHPPPSLGHHHPHRLRTRSSSTSNATAALNSATTNNATSSIPGSNNNSTSNNNSILHSLPSINNNHHASLSSLTNPTGSSNGNPSSIALQYPHQQPHQVQQQHHTTIITPIGNTTNSSTIISSSRHSAGRNVDGGSLLSNGRSSSNSSFFTHRLPNQAIGGGIMAISGPASGSAMISAAALNPPMAIVAGDDGEGTMTSTTVLTFPPTSTTAVAVDPSNSINVQLISCVNINRDNRGGIDLSWRNPYHVPGTSIGRCRAYSRDITSAVGNSAASTSRGTRGRRTSNSSLSGPSRSSLPGASSNVSHTSNETPEGMTDRSIRSEHTVTPQRSLSLPSPDAGERSSRATSTGGRPSLENDPGWACTKRLGLTLCFLAFILLGTVGAKFMIQGPGVIDTSRAGKAEAAAYFLFTELVFVAFAMALFFLGVACLRKRTNDYLLRQFNQYILNTSATAGVAGGAMGGIPRQDAYDFVYYDGENGGGGGGGGGSPHSRNHHHYLHHNLHHGGFHNFHHHRSNGSLMEEGEFGSGDLNQSPGSFHGAGPIHYPAHYSSSRHGSRSKPPPYHIALYLPLPEGMGGETSSPTDTQSNEHDSNKTFGKITDGTDGNAIIDSSAAKDSSDVPGSNNNSINENGYSSSRNREDAGENEDNRAETPPPPYEQL